jgi:hypothetical protein
MLKNFKASTFSRFYNSRDGKKAELGTWKPWYYTYQWVGNKQYLVVASIPKVQLFGMTLDLQPVMAGVEYKDMVNLKEPGVYYMHRKSK